MATIVSFALYLLTFIIALYLGRQGDYVNRNIKRAYTIWLYIFLCFGYMTGSDWRAYEIEYEFAVATHESHYITEIGFYGIYVAFSSFIYDFFLTLGILKCIYLYTLIKLLKSYTTHWLTAIALLMPISLLFVLIDNPLRFMCALVFVNLALYYNHKHKNLLTYILLVIAVLFHTTAITFIIMPIILKFSYRFFSIKNYLLVIFYVVVLYLTSDINLINNIKTSLIGVLLTGMEIKDYSSYTVENDDAFFTIGSFLQIAVFILVLASKKFIKKDDRNLISLFGITITYLFFQRFFLLIPSGFRLVIPYGYYFSIYITCLLVRKKIISYILITYLCLAMCKNLYTEYVYLPYSNSIPYIITQTHKNADYRDKYNKDAYFERMGKDYEGGFP